MSEIKVNSNKDQVVVFLDRHYKDYVQVIAESIKILQREVIRYEYRTRISTDR